MNIGKFYFRLLLILAIGCEVVRESHASTKRGKGPSLSERANQSYYKAVARARRLKQVLQKRRRGINDPADMYFMLQNKLFKYTWWYGRYVRMPDPMSPGLSSMLNRLAKSHKTPLNKDYEKDKFVPLVPLYPRFAPKKVNTRQMQCSLNMSFIPMRHYLKIGVLILVVEFTSSCRTDTFRKYIWVNTWDTASNIVFEIGSKNFVFLWTKPERAHDSKLLFMEYQTVKMLNEFKAEIFELDPRIRRMIARGKMYPKIKKISPSLTKKRPGKRVKTKRKTSATKSLDIVGRKQWAAERNLSDRIYDDRPTRHYESRFHRRYSRRYLSSRRNRRPLSYHRSRNLRNDRRAPYYSTYKITSRRARRYRGLRKIRKHSRANARAKTQKLSRTSDKGQQRNKSRRQKKSNQIGAKSGKQAAYTKRLHPDELPHEDTNHPMNQNYIEDNEENPHNKHDKFVDPQTDEEVQYETKQHPSRPFSRYHLKNRNIKARNHFIKRSFQTLEARNPPLQVKIVHIEEPYDFFPKVQARDPNVINFFLESNDETMPFWEIAVINRIWTGVNPQICEAKYIRNIRNSHIKCVL